MKGYEQGKSTTFTPGRDSKWTENFNDILNKSSHMSRNKLTEVLLEMGISTYLGNGESKRTPQHQDEASPDLDGFITLECDGLSEDRIEFLKTPYFQNLFNIFIDSLFKNMESTASNGPILNDVIAAEPNSLVDDGIEEKDLPAEQDMFESSSNTKQEDINSLQITQIGTRKKANLADALDFVRSTKQD